MQWTLCCTSRVLQQQVDFRSTLPETNEQSYIDASVGSSPGQIAPLRPAREPKRQTQAELSAQRLVLHLDNLALDGLVLRVCEAYLEASNSSPEFSSTALQIALAGFDLLFF